MKIFRTFLKTRVLRNHVIGIHIKRGTPCTASYKQILLINFRECFFTFCHTMQFRNGFLNFLL